MTHIFIFDVSLKELDDIRREHVSITKSRFNDLYTKHVRGVPGQYIIIQISPALFITCEGRKIFTNPEDYLNYYEEGSNKKLKK